MKVLIDEATHSYRVVDATPQSPGEAQEFKNNIEEESYYKAMRLINEAIDDHIPGQKLHVVFKEEIELRRPLIYRLEQEFQQTWASVEIIRFNHNQILNEAFIYDEKALIAKNGFKVHVVGPDEAAKLTVDEIETVKRVINLVNKKAKTEFYTGKRTYVTVKSKMREFVKDEIERLLKREWKLVETDYKNYGDFLTSITVSDRI